MAKTIKGTIPAELTSQEDYTALLQHANLQYLVNSAGNAIFSFAALVDGAAYVAGPQRVGQPRGNTTELASTLLKELEEEIPIFVDEVQRNTELAVALIAGVDHKWHGLPSTQKPKKSPILLFAGTPALGDNAMNLSDHELGKIKEILIPGFSVFELRAVLRKLPGLQQTKVADLWLLWSFLVGVPAYYEELWKLNQLQPLVKPLDSLDSDSLKQLDQLFAIADQEYRHLTAHLPNDKARGVLASLSMKVHPGNEINEGLKILQEKGLIEEWVDLAMTKDGTPFVHQHVVASSFLRNVMIIRSGLGNKAALVGDLQGRALEQMVASLIMELNDYGVCPFPFESSGSIKAWQVTSSQHDVDGIYELEGQRLVIYDLKRRSQDFFALESKAPTQGKKDKGKGKGTQTGEEKVVQDEVTVHGGAAQNNQESKHFESFLKHNVLPHVEAISKIAQCEIKHVYVVALAGFMEHPEQDILARMNEAAKFVQIGLNLTCHVDSLEAFEARCDKAKIDFPVFDTDGGWPLVDRPIFKRVHQALERACRLERPLLLRGTRRCGKTCCLRYLQREFKNAKYVSLNL